MASPFARYAFKTLKLEKPLNTPIKRIVIDQKDFSLSTPILNSEVGWGVRGQWGCSSNLNTATND